MSSVRHCTEYFVFIRSHVFSQPYEDMLAECDR